MTAPLLPVGTVIPAGTPAPPTTTQKASAGFMWGAAPVLLGLLVEVLTQAQVLFPDAPPWVLQVIAFLLFAAGPVASYFGVKITPNLLLQPVVIAASVAPIEGVTP